MRIRIGEKLRLLRGQNSQTSIAKIMGVSQPCWQAWETDKREPNVTTIYDICTKLNCSADWLLGLEIPSPTQTDANDKIITVSDCSVKNGTKIIDCSKCDLMKAAIKIVKNFGA